MPSASVKSASTGSTKSSSCAPLISTWKIKRVISAIVNLMLMVIILTKATTITTLATTAVATTPAIAPMLPPMAEVAADEAAEEAAEEDAEEEAEDEASPPTSPDDPSNESISSDRLRCDSFDVLESSGAEQSHSSTCCEESSATARGLSLSYDTFRVLSRFSVDAPSGLVICKLLISSFII